MDHSMPLIDSPEVAKRWCVLESDESADRRYNSALSIAVSDPFTTKQERTSYESERV